MVNKQISGRGLFTVSWSPVESVIFILSGCSLFHVLFV
jgi:hypothetical protein